MLRKKKLVADLNYLKGQLAGYQIMVERQKVTIDALTDKLYPEAALQRAASEARMAALEQDEPSRIADPTPAPLYDSRTGKRIDSTDGENREVLSPVVPGIATAGTGEHGPVSLPNPPSTGYMPSGNESGM